MENQGDSTPMSYEVVDTGILAGVDGIRGGWLAIYKDLKSGTLWYGIHQSAHDIFFCKPHLVAMDIPVGLEEDRPRECDLLARKILGRARGASIFPAPVRVVLKCTRYKHASDLQFKILGKRLSKQSWNIVGKIKEVDEMIGKNPSLGEVIREIHPELSFFFLNNQSPLAHSKKTRPGYQERYSLLKPIFGKFLDYTLYEARKAGCRPDDILDAVVALWSAERVLTGEAVQIPSPAPINNLGVKIAINA